VKFVHPTEVAVDALAEAQDFGRLELAAYRRHLWDIERSTSSSFPYYYDATEGEAPIRYAYNVCRHSKGEWAGQPVVLEPWQQFIFASAFGWRRKSDGARRYRVLYIEVPRKNGKTTMCAVIGPYLAFLDGEPGAEVYCVATKKEQAKILFDEAKRMVEASPQMAFVEVLKANLNDGASKMEPLGRDSKTTDGLNVHAALIDEVHRHRSSDMIDVMQSASGARRQPMRIEITTAGVYEPTSVCWMHHQYSVNILEAAEQQSAAFADDTWFAFIAAADPDDDYTAEQTWIKANPNYGISVKPEYIAIECERAKQIPSEQNVFRQMHTNQWPMQKDRAIDMALWMRCRERAPLPDLLGATCYGGLDLASTQDLTAFSLVFPVGDGMNVDVLVWYWMPTEGLIEKQRVHMALYSTWADMGHLTLTQGNVADYGQIKNDIVEICSRYNVQDIAYDRWNQAQVVPRLMEEGLPMVPFGQGFQSMNGPCKEVLRLVACGGFRHGDNPILHWNAANVEARYDEAQNIKWDRRRAQVQKIDGLQAATMAIGVSMLAMVERPSVAEQQGGLRVVDMQ
jgi:phage terminase large subunit-like protein